MAVSEKQKKVCKRVGQGKYPDGVLSIEKK